MDAAPVSPQDGENVNRTTSETLGRADAAGKAGPDKGKKSPLDASRHRLKIVQQDALMLHIANSRGYMLFTHCKRAREIAAGMGLSLPQRDKLLLELEAKGLVRFANGAGGLPIVKLATDDRWRQWKAEQAAAA